MKYLLPLFAFLVIRSCGNSESSESEKVKFELVGYFKSPTKLRYYTFAVQTSLNLDNPLEFEEFKKQVSQHGSKQTNTAGQITACFYYETIEGTPDITTLNATQANKTAHDYKPILAYWNLGNGNNNLIERP